MECIFSSTAQHAPTDLGKHERKKEIKKEGKKKEKEITSNKSKVWCTSLKQNSNAMECTKSHKNIQHLKQEFSFK
jgi:hypothetical protein